MFKTKYKIVADSSSNLCQKNDSAIATVPLKILTSEKEYTDDASLDVIQMVKELAECQGKTSTSCPNIYDWLNAFDNAEHIFCITITSALSGAYESAMQAKQEYEKKNPGAKVHVFDSLSTGPEISLMIERLSQNIQQEMEFNEIVLDIEKYQQKTHLLFALESVQNLARNGRIHPAMAKIVGVLNLRIVGEASDEGTLAPLHKCRGNKRAIQKLFEEMKTKGYQGKKVRIDHCDNEASAISLKNLIMKEYPDADIQVKPCRGLCSYYAEQGGILVGFEE